MQMRSARTETLGYLPLSCLARSGQRVRTFNLTSRSTVEVTRTLEGAFALYSFESTCSAYPGPRTHISEGFSVFRHSAHSLGMNVYLIAILHRRHIPVSNLKRPAIHFSEPSTAVPFRLHPGYLNRHGPGTRVVLIFIYHQYVAWMVADLDRVRGPRRAVAFEGAGNLSLGKRRYGKSP